MPLIDEVEEYSLKQGYAYARVRGEWEVVIVPEEHVGCTKVRTALVEIDGAVCVVFKSYHGKLFAQTVVMARNARMVANG